MSLRYIERMAVVSNSVSNRGSLIAQVVRFCAIRRACSGWTIAARPVTLSCGGTPSYCAQGSNEELSASYCNA